VTEIGIPVGEEYDGVAAELITNDPDALWLDVTRTVDGTSGDGGTTSEGQGFVDQVDLATDRIVLSVSQGEILDS
jgi:hypothetical protein